MTMIAARGNEALLGVLIDEPSPRFSVGHPAPLSTVVTTPAALTATAGSSGNVTMTGGKYFVSFVCESGETDTSPASGAVSPSSKVVDLTSIPTSSDSSCYARRIYRSESGLLADAYFLRTIWDNSTASYTDNMAVDDASLDKSIKPKAYNQTGANGGFVFMFPETFDLSPDYKVAKIKELKGKSGQARSAPSVIDVAVAYKRACRAGYLVPAVASMLGAPTVTNNADGTNTYVFTPSKAKSSPRSISLIQYEGGSISPEVILSAMLEEIAFKVDEGKIVEDTEKGTAVHHCKVGQAIPVGATTSPYTGLPVFRGVRFDAGKASLDVYAKATAGASAGAFTVKFKVAAINRPGPTSVLTAALKSPAAPGNIENGAHYYAFSFYNGTGETELSTVSNTVTVVDKTTNGQVSLSGIPIGPAGTTGRKIYRTATGGSTLILLTTIANNTATTFTDNVADASLIGAAPTTNGTTSYGSTTVSFAYDTTANHQTKAAGNVTDWCEVVDSNGGARLGADSGENRKPFSCCFSGDVSLIPTNAEWRIPYQMLIPGEGTTAGSSDGTYTGVAPRTVSAPRYTMAHAGFSQGTSSPSTLMEIDTADVKLGWKLKETRSLGKDAAVVTDFNREDDATCIMTIARRFFDRTYENIIQGDERIQSRFLLEGELIPVNPGVLSTLRESVQVDVAQTAVTAQKQAVSGPGLIMETLTLEAEQPDDLTLEPFTITINTRQRWYFPA